MSDWDRCTHTEQDHDGWTRRCVKPAQHKSDKHILASVTTLDDLTQVQEGQHVQK